MKIIKFLWFLISIIFLLWIYYLFIAPNLFTKNIVIVPDVCGLKEEEAKDLLSYYNLDYSITYVEGGSNDVIYSIPGEKTNVYEGHCVMLYIEYIPNEKYPLFEGLLYDECKNDIKIICDKYNLTLDIIYVYSDGIDNQIIHQDKSINEDINDSDTLTLTINKSNAYFEMPNIVGMNVLEAFDLLHNYNFNYSIIYYYSPLDEDIIIFQEIECGKSLKKNALHDLKIFVSKGMPKSLDELNISSFCNILNELNYKYDIIYVDSQYKDVVVSFYFDFESNRYKLVVTG